MSDLEVAIAAARAGGDVVERAFGTATEAELKSRFNPVTEIDRAAERAVLEVIARDRPGDAVLAEESGGERAPGRHWIVDPLDGTVNFVHGIPQISVSVALYDGDTPLAAVIFDPLRDELFDAEASAGARINGSPMAVSSTPSMEESVVATGFPYDHGQYAAGYAHALGRVLERVNGIRRFGSAALDLAWVAAGRYDGYWELGVAPWDQAAGILLVREAGGVVTDAAGTPSTPFTPLVVAANPRVHEELRSTVAGAVPQHLR